MRQPRTRFAVHRPRRLSTGLGLVQAALFSIGLYLLAILFLVDLAERLR